jgi:hypothetical protein
VSSLSASVAKLEVLVSELLSALEACQFDCRQKCPVCAGWDVGPNGETIKVHASNCIVGHAIKKAKAFRG